MPNLFEPDEDLDSDDSDLLEEAEEVDSLAGADYNRIAYYYDVEYEKIRLDFDFYREMARRAGANARILELACGAGSPDATFVKSGF